MRSQSEDVLLDDDLHRIIGIKTFKIYANLHQ
jgi:hypothetical protein